MAELREKLRADRDSPILNLFGESERNETMKSKGKTPNVEYLQNKPDSTAELPNERLFLSIKH